MKVPSYETFEESFLKLYYTQAETSDKKVVQYILRTYEYYCAGTDEVAVANMTVEHILPEFTSVTEVGYIGNLLPLGQSINSSSGDDDFSKKLEDYKKSRYQSVVNFSKQYSDTSKWGKEEIIKRTKYLARCIAVSLFAGTGILLYILAAVLMPKANETRKDLQEVVQPEHSGANARD